MASVQQAPRYGIILELVRSISRSRVSIVLRSLYLIWSSSDYQYRHMTWCR